MSDDDVVAHLPMRARTAPTDSRDLHPRWSDGSPVLLGQHVMHAKKRWQGFVTGIPTGDEVCVAWWSPVDDDYGDGQEHAPEDLLLPLW